MPINVIIINPIAMEAGPQSDRQLNQGNFLSDVLCVKNDQLARHLGVIVKQAHHIAVPFSSIRATWYEDWLLAKLVRSCKVFKILLCR